MKTTMLKIPEDHHADIPDLVRFIMLRHLYIYV